MKISLISKIAGWGQFAVTVLGTLATSGLPTNPVSWVTWIASLASAIGTHAAASTSGKE